MSEATANGGAANSEAARSEAASTAANGHAAGGPANGSRADRAAHDGAVEGAPRRPAPLTLVPTADEKLTTRDFKSDQEVRWCPGCGDYAILAAFQSFLPELGVARENVVVISGIGCSSPL